MKVRISKYMHSRGICHKDLHLGNLMFRGNKGFVIGKLIHFFFSFVVEFIYIIFVNNKIYFVET